MEDHRWQFLEMSIASEHLDAEAQGSRIDDGVSGGQLVRRVG
jgi:hypothetical protein